MSDDKLPEPSSLLQYLPAIFQEHPFLGQFLRAFETELLGDPGGPGTGTGSGGLDELNGLEQKIASLSAYLDPQQTPERFLPWLSSWTGFALRADLPPEKKRDFVASAISLYRMRGTKENMERLLEIFTSRKATVKDDVPDRPFYFRVRISFDTSHDIARNRAIAHALIEREKPAHTAFELNLSFPTMKIGQCRIGTENSYLSGAFKEKNP